MEAKEFKDRYYQVDSQKAILSDWASGLRAVLLILPTGTGKTIVFCQLTQKLIVKGEAPILILAHRDELLDQAAKKLKNVAGIDAEKEQGENTIIGNTGFFSTVVVGTTQTLSNEKRLTQFKKDHFKYIIIDEAHRAITKSNLKILEYFSEAKVLGVTATHDRADKQDLGVLFEKVSYLYTLPQAVKDGFLVPIRARTIPLQIDISDCFKAGGAVDDTALGHALEPYLVSIGEQMAKYCRTRKTVVFMPLIATSQKFQVVLDSLGFNTFEVNGMSKDRKEKIKAFADAGNNSIMLNSMLLTEGWDCPSVDCVVVLRMTKSRGLYTQMVGRGTRLSPETNKEYLLLLDFLWHCERHKLCHPSSLIAKTQEMADKATDKILEIEGGGEYEAEGVDVLEAFEEAESDAIREREEALAKELSRQRRKKSKEVDVLQFEISINDNDLSDYRPTFPQELAPPSEKQKEFLKDRGIDAESVDNAGKASLLIEKLINRQKLDLTSPKQIRLLEKYGFLKVGLWSFSDATKIINKLAANRWRRSFGRNTSYQVYLGDNKEGKALQPNEYKPIKGYYANEN